MAEILKMRVADTDYGNAIVETNGRIYFRLPTQVLSWIQVLGGLVPVCDTNGTLYAVDGDVVATVVVLDTFENLMGLTEDGRPGIVTLPRWQASVN